MSVVIPNQDEEPMSVALKRGLIGGAILAGGALCSSMGIAAADGGLTVIETVATLAGAGTTFFGYLAIRTGVEGSMDQSRTGKKTR
jgi:hypothetical protein